MEIEQILVFSIRGDLLFCQLVISFLALNYLIWILAPILQPKENQNKVSKWLRIELQLFGMVLKINADIGNVAHVSKNIEDFLQKYIKSKNSQEFLEKETKILTPDQGKDWMNLEKWSKMVKIDYVGLKSRSEMIQISS